MPCCERSLEAETADDFLNRKISPYYVHQSNREKEKPDPCSRETLHQERFEDMCMHLSVHLWEYLQ